MWLPPHLAKVIFFTIATTMGLWMKGYVALQRILHGNAIFTPKNRTMPVEFGNASYGTHHFENISNITFHYVKKGCDKNNSRPMLLLLHGFLDFWYIWNKQIPELSSNYCIIAPDLRGYGNTSKPEDSANYLMDILVGDVKNLIEALRPSNETKVVLVGHDWGGMIAFCFATLYEQIIDKLIIINGMHPQAFRKQLFRSITQMRMSWYMLPFRKPDIPEKFLIMNDFNFFENIHKGAFTVEEENATKYVFSQPGALSAALNYYRAFNNDSNNLDRIPYTKINTTTLLLWAEDDEFLTPPVAWYNRRWLNSSKVVYYPSAGHWVLRECPSQINVHIRNFVNTGNTERHKARHAKHPRKCAESPNPRRRGWLRKFLPGIPLNVKLPNLPNGE